MSKRQATESPEGKDTKSSAKRAAIEEAGASARKIGLSLLDAGGMPAETPFTPGPRYVAYVNEMSDAIKGVMEKNHGELEPKIKFAIMSFAMMEVMGRLSSEYTGTAMIDESSISKNSDGDLVVTVKPNQDKKENK